MNSDLQKLINEYLPKVVGNPLELKNASQIALSTPLKFPDYLSFLEILMWGATDIKSNILELSKLNIPTKICGKMINVVWFCETCCLDGTSCYCTECFDKNLHIGHKYNYVMGSSALCDCGDKTAINPNGFCKIHQACQDEKKILSENLSKIPAHLIKSVPLTLELIMKKLHEILLTDIQNPTVFMQTFTKTIYILKFCAKLCSASPIMQHWVEEGFDEIFPEHLTEHICKTKYFVDEIQRKKFIDKMSNIEKPKEDNKKHACQCSVLELLMSLYSCLIQNQEIYMFISKLIKQQENFPPKVALAFCQNINPIIKYMNTQTIDEFQTATSQFLNGAWASYIVSNPEFMPVVLQLFKDYFSLCESESEKHRISSLIFIQITAPIFSEKPGKILANNIDFWKQFISIVSKIELSGICDDLSIKEKEIYKSVGVFGAFSIFIKHIDLNNDELLTIILTELRKIIEQSLKTAKNYLQDINFITIESERIFGWILNTLLIHYIMENKLEGMDSKSKMLNFKQKTMKLLNFIDEKQFDLFIEDLLQICIKVISFIGNLRNKPFYAEFLRLEYFKIDIEHYYHIDMCLLNLCLLLIEKPYKLLEFTDLYCKIPWNGSALISASIEEMKNMNNILEMMLYSISSVIYNDYPILRTYAMVCSHHMGPSVFYLYKGAELPNYFIPKQILSAYLSEDKIYTSLKRLEKKVEFYYRNENIPFYVENLLTRKKAGAETLFIIKPESLENLNLLWDSMIERLSTYEEKLKGIFDEIVPKGGKKPNICDVHPYEKIQGIYEVLIRKLSETDLIEKLVILLSTNTRISENAKILAIMIIYKILTCGNKSENLVKIAEKMPEFIDNLRKISVSHPVFNSAITKIIEILTGKNETSPMVLVDTSEKIEKPAKNYKEKQKEIMAQFAAKQKQFFEKQKDFIKHDSENAKDSKQEITSKMCVICKEELNQMKIIEKPYGLLASFGFNNLTDKAYKDAIQEIKSTYGKNVSITENHDEFLNFLNLRTCGHYIHYECGYSYINSNSQFETLHKTYSIILCPLCRTLEKIIIPDILQNNSDLNKNLIWKSEIIKAENLQLMQKIFIDNSIDAEKILENLIAMLISNIRLIDSIGIFEFWRSKILSINLVIRNTLLNLLTKVKESEKLFEIILNKRNEIDKFCDNSEILYKNNIEICYKYMLLGEIYNFIAQNIILKPELPLFDKIFSQLIERIVIQICTKNIILSLCQEKEKGLFDFTEIKFNFEKILHEISYELEKIYICSQFNNDILPQIDENTEKIEGKIRLFNICKLLQVDDKNIISLIQKIESNGEFTKKIISQIKTQNNLIEMDKFTLLSGTKKPIKLIQLEPDFCKLCEKYMLLACPTCTKKCSNYSICLYCGTLVCASNCCTKMEELTHSITCQGIEGLFLNLTNGSIRIITEFGIYSKESFYCNSMGNSVDNLLSSFYNYKDTELQEYKLNMEKYLQLQESCAKNTLAAHIIQ